MSDYEEYAKSLSFELESVRKELKECEDDRYIEEQEKLRLEKENAELRAKLEEGDLEILEEEIKKKIPSAFPLRLVLYTDGAYKQWFKKFHIHFAYFHNINMGYKEIMVSANSSKEAIKAFRQKLEEL